MGTGYTGRSQTLSNAPGTSSPGWIRLRMHGKCSFTFYGGSQFLSAALTHVCPRPLPTVASPRYGSGCRIATLCVCPGRCPQRASYGLRAGPASVGETELSVAVPRASILTCHHVSPRLETSYPGKHTCGPKTTARIACLRDGETSMRKRRMHTPNWGSRRRDLGSP